MKHPAFLFYVDRFYGGTRMMTPEERCCYIDLLCFQHLNEYIPNDINKISMYCTGVKPKTVKSVLEEKFVLSDKGWQNLVMAKVAEDRNDFSKKQSINGTVGQFWKKAIKFFNTKDYKSLKTSLSELNNDELYEEIKDLDLKSKALVEAKLQAMLKHYGSVNVNNTINNKSVEIRKEEFRQSLLPFVEQFGKEMIRKFFDYWTELDTKSKKMRYEDQKYFEISRRLSTWHGMSNDKLKKENHSGTPPIYDQTTGLTKEQLKAI